MMLCMDRTNDVLVAMLGCLISSCDSWCDADQLPVVADSDVAVVVASLPGCLLEKLLFVDLVALSITGECPEDSFYDP